MEEIRIGVAHRGAGLAPVFAAVEGGYFREHGLEPRLVFVPGPPARARGADRRGGRLHQLRGAELILANLQPAATRCHRFGDQPQRAADRRRGRASRRAEELRGKRWGVISPQRCRRVRDRDGVRALGLGRRQGCRDRGGRLRARPRLDLLLDAKQRRRRRSCTRPSRSRPSSAAGTSSRTSAASTWRSRTAALRRRGACCASAAGQSLRYVRAYCQAVYRFRTDAQFGIDVLRKYTGRDRRGRHGSRPGCCLPG